MFLCTSGGRHRVICAPRPLPVPDSCAGAVVYLQVGAMRLPANNCDCKFGCRVSWNPANIAGSGNPSAESNHAGRTAAHKCGSGHTGKVPGYDPCPKYFLQCASCSVAFFLLGCTSDALSARRASQTKRSLPLRTTAVMGAVMIPSSSKIADRSGRYSVRIASCKATLEVEITMGSFIRSGRCICQRIQPTR